MSEINSLVRWGNKIVQIISIGDYYTVKNIKTNEIHYAWPYHLEKLTDSDKVKIL